MKYICKIALTATSLFLSAYAASAGTNIETSFGFGLSDAKLAEYTYTDGSTKTLIAGNGLGLAVNQTLTTLNSVDVIAGLGFQWGSIGDSSTSTLFYDGFTYFPLELNAKYHITKEIAVKGGISYLLFPMYMSQEGDQKAKFKGTSNLGYNVALHYDIGGVYFYGKYSANTVAYTELSDGNGNSADITGAVDDEIVNVFHLGVGINFDMFSK
ncbi:hypothetical protein KO489_06790 [Reinekea forsetii]|nr:hypothetical protein [Reinekea forsetii]